TGLFAVGVRTLLRPPSGQAPTGGRMIPVTEIGAEVRTLYEGRLGYGTVQIPDPSHQQWLEREDGGAGRYLAVRFDVEGEAVGWALGRVFSRGGVVEAAIVEIFAPSPTPALYEWMVSGMVSHLARLSPRFIRARATCPMLGRALQRNRFLRGRPKPVLFWPGGGHHLPEPIHIARSAGDEPFSPYARGEGRGTRPG
ncbi:MAG: hypothetical protein O6952_02470, partial [Planctomycetota bacterium]|nr:hypothetical protein [Planctomycetota bacterium]